jgi:hypothetical protein
MCIQCLGHFSPLNFKFLIQKTSYPLTYIRCIFLGWGCNSVVEHLLVCTRLWVQFLAQGGWKEVRHCDALLRKQRFVGLRLALAKS